MKKYFVCSDIHSFYNLWMKALQEAGFEKDNPNHILIHCGDLLDRGEDPEECLNFVNNLPTDRKILIRGNHEDLIEECISRGYFLGHDIHNFTHDTACKLTGKVFNEDTDYEILDALQEYEPLWIYLDSCVDFAEVGNNIFVHGWIPYESEMIDDPEKEGYVVINRYIADDWREPYKDWASARWLNGMDCWDRGIRLPGKTVYCGHYHCSWGNSNLHNDGVEFLEEIETYYIDPETGKQNPYINWNPFKDEGIVALDACTAYSHIVNIEVIEVNEDEDKNNS